MKIYFDIMKKSHMMKIFFIEYKFILTEYEYILTSYEFLFFQYFSKHKRWPHYVVFTRDKCIFCTIFTLLYGGFEKGGHLSHKQNEKETYHYFQCTFCLSFTDVLYHNIFFFNE